MVRLILAILCGILAAFGVVMLTDVVVHALSPGTPSAPGTPEMETYVAGLPVAPLAAFAIGCGVAAAVGAFIAARFGRRGAWPGWVVAGLLLLATAANFAMIAHPVWVVAASVILILAAGWAAAQAGARR